MSHIPMDLGWPSRELIHRPPMRAAVVTVEKSVAKGSTQPHRRARRLVVAASAPLSGGMRSAERRIWGAAGRPVSVLRRLPVPGQKAAGELAGLVTVKRSGSVTNLGLTGLRAPLLLGSICPGQGR